MSAAGTSTRTGSSARPRCSSVTERALVLRSRPRILGDEGWPTRHVDRRVGRRRRRDVRASRARRGSRSDPPKDQDYDVRSYRVKDPEGVSWGFMKRLGTGYIQKKSLDEGGLEEVLPGRGLGSADGRPPPHALPIPDRKHVGLVTYDAKDPDTSFPPIEPLLPPAGAPNVLIVLHRRRRLRRVERVRRSVPDADAERLAANGLQVHALPHDGAVLADAGRAAVGPQPPHRRAWAASPRSRPRRPATARCGPTRARRWPRPCGSTGTPPPSSASATRCRCGRPARWARSTAGRTRAAGSSTSTASSAARRTSTTRRCTTAPCRSSTPKSPEEGYHLTEDMTDKAIAWVRQQKALMPDKPFFAYFAPGATHAPHHVPEEWAERSTRASSTRAGTRCARRRSPVRRRSA